MPVYEKEIDTGKGPQLFLPGDDSLVAPDLFAFRCNEVKGNTIKWIEAKHKTVFTWHRISRPPRWTTGIDLRHYHDYLKVADASPWEVWLFFLHRCSTPYKRDIQHGCPKVCPTGLFVGELSVLRGCENHRSDRWAKGMVYWAEDRLKLLASLQEVEQCTSAQRVVATASAAVVYRPSPMITPETIAQAQSEPPKQQENFLD